MAPEAPRVATRASRAPRSPRGLLAVPWWSLTVLAILVVAATRAAADAEVYQEYARSARDEAAPAAAAPKWPEPDSEDEFVDRISMLMGPSKEGGRDLAAQRLRLSRLREEQEEKEREQQKQQQQQEDSLQKQLQGERASHESPQQQQQQVRPRPAQETKASAKAPQQQQQRPVDDTERQMQLYWQEAARAALAKQQKEAVSKATLARQQEAETKAAQEAAKARQAEAAKAALSKQQEVAAQQEEAKALYAKQQQEEARQAAAAAKAKQEEAVAAAKDEQQLEDLDDAYDIARALTQQPSVPAIDQTLLRTYMRSLGPQVGSVDQVGPIWQRYWDQVLASLSQQGLQQQQQPAVSDLIAELLNDAERQTQQTQQRQREMQWQAQQQQQTQDRQQQMLLQAQHEQMDPSTAQKMLLQQQQQTQQQPQQQQQPPFTYTFQKPEQSSRFAINPADPRFWQEDPRLQYLVSRSGGVDGSQPQEDQYDEGSSGVRQALIRSASGLSIPMDLGVSSEQQPDQPDDMVDVDEDLGAVGDDMWLPQQRQQQQRQQQGARVTPPVVPEGIRHQPKPTATRDSRLDEESGRGSNLSNHDYPVVKKQLTFPKDHWFFGMDDVGKLAIFIGASIAVSSMILGFIVWQYRLHRNAKAAADVEYPAYGVTGPNKDVSPTGDRRLAQSAQMYHYQHQKQQILAMESRAAGGRRGSMSEAESEDENEEGDYTVYECPGLAPTQEMEVKNPLFQDDPTPATPAPGVGAEAGHDGDGLPEGGKQQQQQAGKTKQDKHSNNGKTTRSKPSDKSDRP